MTAKTNRQKPAEAAIAIGKEDEALLEEPVQIDGVDYYVGFTKEYVKVAVRSEKRPFKLHGSRQDRRGIE